MSYIVQAGGKDRGPYSVLDTALNDAIKVTTPPPKPPKPLTHVARTLGTTDEDPYGPVTPRITLVAIVFETDGYRQKRIRAFVDDGHLRWATPCKVCDGDGRSAGVPGFGGLGGPRTCPSCHGVGVVRDLG